MTRTRFSVVLALGLAVVVAVGGAWWFGRQHALASVRFIDVSADTVAQSMQDDHFYSDYGDAVLVVHGTVASVQGTGLGRRIWIRTNSRTGLTCDLTVPTSVDQPAAGAAISLVAPGGTALREPAAVDFPDCRLMSAPTGAR